MLQKIDANLWEISRPIKMPGLRMDHRMTVVRLGSGGLLLHSPVSFDTALAKALAELGPVEHLVAPSRYHDMYWTEWFREYPVAEFFCAPGVKGEHPELRFQHVLGSESAPSWAGELETCLIRGIPKINEVAFFHKATRTLIVADLVFNLSTDQNILAKLFLKLNGIYGRVGCSRFFRAFIKDRAAFDRSIDEIFEWDFDRLVPGHGPVVERNGRVVLKQALGR